MKPINKTEMNTKQLKQKFFDECTTDVGPEEIICYAFTKNPVELFKWFEENILSELSAWRKSAESVPGDIRRHEPANYPHRTH